MAAQPWELNQFRIGDIDRFLISTKNIIVSIMSPTTTGLLGQTRPGLDAKQLLAAYSDRTSCFFASPAQTLLARGVRSVLPSSVANPDLPRRAKALLSEQSQTGLPPMPLMGAIPFDNSANVYLFVPEEIDRAGPLEKGNAPFSSQNADPNAYSLQEIPAPVEYMQGVARALERIERSELLKVVLSRSLELSLPNNIDLGRLLSKLAYLNRYGYTYLLKVPPSLPFGLDGTTEARTLIGASPELLVRRRGMQVEANPLAGSAPRSGDLATDRERARALMGSAKDRREHAFVVDAIAEILRPLCCELDIPADPCILQTDSMMHLSTCLRGKLRETDTCSLSLALALHPTPAICGSPTASAYSAIQEIESFSRGYFTGMVGWVDRQGNGEWAIAIRCGEAVGNRLRLYAGAGIVAGSSPEKELAETSAKFRTMLKAVGVEQEVKA